MGGKRCSEGRKRLEVFPFYAPEYIGKELSGLPLAFLGQQIVHICGEAADKTQSQILTVILNVAVCRHIVEMLGSCDLCGIFSGQIDTGFLYQFNKAVKLAGSNKGVDRIGKNNQFCRFQSSTGRCKIFFQQLNLSSCIQIGKFLSGKELFQLEYRLESDAVISFGTSVDN